MITTKTSLSEYGVVPTPPGTDTTKLWAVTFTGGVNAQTVHFDDCPEDRALEALMQRFGQPNAHIMAPTQLEVA